jgi:uncharacterized protein YdeI (YjbR/CyaY-like superfamily)
MYKGILFSMAVFKAHCAFMFWKGTEILDERNQPVENKVRWKRITTLKDLPSNRILLGYIKKAMQLNDEGVKRPRKTKSNPGNKELIVPADFAGAVSKNPKAKATFESMSYNKRKDYVEWVTEAKTEETRLRRLQTSVEWLAEGKSRNWKYERC